MSPPPSAPPQSPLCARCGRRYPAGSEHACETTERAATLPATPASTPALPETLTETVNLGLASTLASPTGPAPPAELGTLPTLTSPPAAQTPVVGLSSSGLNPAYNPQDALIGTVINERFKVLRRIGKGGMGAVYKARHLTLDTNVAIKVLLYQRSHDDQERFIQEAKLASKVRHPNTVYISDFGLLPDGRLYLVMELLAGRILSSEISSGPLELARALQIAIQITRGLQAVHDKGIVHRDMKPENVFLLDQDGTHDFVKIVDFGIAKATSAASLTEDASSPLNVSELEKALLAEEVAKSGPWAKTETRAGQTIGTPPYMSPEQVQSLPVDYRTDQYALGCMLYEMLTGVPPFSGEGSQVARGHLYGELLAPRRLAPEAAIAPELEAIVLRALSRQPAGRFARMQELGAALTAQAEGSAPLTGRPSRPRIAWRPLVIGALSALTATAGLVLALSQPRRAAPGHAAAPQSASSERLGSGAASAAQVSAVSTATPGSSSVRAKARRPSVKPVASSFTRTRVWSAVTLAQPVSAAIATPVSASLTRALPSNRLMAWLPCDARRGDQQRVPAL